MVSTGPVGGVELLRAWFAGKAYDKHRHDTYAVGLTDTGLQAFDYRGATRKSGPGQIVVLYPDEPHDGRSGGVDGFGYRIVYVDPSRLAAAVHALCGGARPLPFVREPVFSHTRLSLAVRSAFLGQSSLEPLAADSLVVELAQGLLDAEGDGRHPLPLLPRIDGGAVHRAREFLNAERTRVVHSAELESITGLTRYDLARQFKRVLGTSPYRYLLMRRLELARQRIHVGRPLAEAACDAGFSDQAHLTRVFRAALGLPPARYRALRSNGLLRGGTA